MIEQTGQDGAGCVVMAKFLACNADATIFWLYVFLLFFFFAYFSRCIGPIDLKLPGAYL